MSFILGCRDIKRRKSLEHDSIHGQLVPINLLLKVQKKENAV